MYREEGREKDMQREEYREGVYRNKCRGGNILLSPPSELLGGEGQNLYLKFKTFGLLDTLKVHIQSNYYMPITLQALISPLNKISRKKQQINFFMFFTLQFQILTV